jgi:hypothetical protein
MPSFSKKIFKFLNKNKVIGRWLTRSHRKLGVSGFS